MKIVLYGADDANYLVDIIYHGLVTLGHTVHDTPRKMNYHQGPDNCPNHLKRYTQVFYNLPVVPPQDSYDIILMDIRCETPPQGNRTFVIDGEDAQSINESWYNGAPLYFKRECSGNLPSKMKSLPFAAVGRDEASEKRNVRERDIDVSCLLSNTHETRRETFDWLSNFRSRYPQYKCEIYEPHEAPPKDMQGYVDILRRSKLAVSVRGAGEDTYRYWECVQRGAVLVSHKTGQRIDNNFVDDNEALFFSNRDQLVTKVANALGNLEWLEGVRQRGITKLVNYHLSTHRAEYILQCIKEVR